MNRLSRRRISQMLFFSVPAAAFLACTKESKVLPLETKVAETVEAGNIAQSGVPIQSTSPFYLSISGGTWKIQETFPILKDLAENPGRDVKIFVPTENNNGETLRVSFVEKGKNTWKIVRDKTGESVIFSAEQQNLVPNLNLVNQQTNQRVGLIRMEEIPTNFERLLQIAAVAAGLLIATWLGLKIAGAVLALLGTLLALALALGIVVLGAAVLAPIFSETFNRLGGSESLERFIAKSEEEWEQFLQNVKTAVESN